MTPKWQIQLDHVAVAVEDPAKLKKVFAILGLKEGDTELIPTQKVRAHFLKSQPSQPAIEILESTDPQGVIGKYLAKKGPGIHHLSFQVSQSSLEALSLELKAQGIRLVYETPQPGAHHTRVNFIHPESTGGVLIEISEKTT